MKLSDINKRYIDDVIEYYIKEIYNMVTFRHFENSSKRENINDMLMIRMQKLIKMDFIIDWKINVNLRNKDEIREDKLDNILYDIENKGSFIEVIYEMIDRSMYSVSISEEELINYTPPF